MPTPIQSALTPYIDAIPDPVVKRAARLMLERGIPMGPYSTSQIANINAEIGAGLVQYTPGASMIRQEDGVLLTLQGLGTSARFAAGTGGVTTQAVKTSAYTLQSSDGNTIIPITGNVTITLDSSSDLTAPVQLIRYDGGTLTLAKSVTVIDPDTGSAWGTLAVANKLASIALYPGSVADEYYAVKIGA